MLCNIILGVIFFWINFKFFIKKVWFWYCFNFFFVYVIEWLLFYGWELWFGMVSCEFIYMYYNNKMWNVIKVIFKYGIFFDLWYFKIIY